MVSARLLTTPPHLIGLDLGGTKLAGGVVTLEPDGAARLLIEERVPTPESSEALVSAMVGMVTHLIGASPHQPVSVGAGIAGHIGLDGVAVQAANTPMTVGVDLVTPWWRRAPFPYESTTMPTWLPWRLIANWPPQRLRWWRSPLAPASAGDWLWAANCGGVRRAWRGSRAT